LGDQQPRNRQLLDVIIAVGGRGVLVTVGVGSFGRAGVQGDADRGAHDGDVSCPKLQDHFRLVQISRVSLEQIGQLRPGLLDEQVLAHVERPGPLGPGVAGAGQAVPASIAGPSVPPMPLGAPAAQSADHQSGQPVPVQVRVVGLSDRTGPLSRAVRAAVTRPIARASGLRDSLALPV
jgi:hypothetical protein